MSTEDSASREGTWQEEAERLLSLLSCFAPEREVVFASSEFLTGKGFYDLCLANEVRTPEELEKKLATWFVSTSSGNLAIVASSITLQD